MIASLASRAAGVATVLFISAQMSGLDAIVVAGLSYQGHAIKPNKDLAKQGEPSRLLCPEQKATMAHMDTALSLGTEFMLQSQHETGHFSYEYDWKLGRDLSEGAEVSPVREAGAAWGLALIALDYKQTHGELPQKLTNALRKTLDFFEKHSELTDKGLRLVAYPGLEKQLGDTGTLAILALANIDYLRTGAADENERARRSKFLKGLLLSLQNAISEDGLVHKSYDLNNQQFLGSSSPYYDGETLLAMTKAAKYLGFSELWSDIDRLSNAGWNNIVKQGLHDHRDLAKMKGYYQWSSMAWHELLTSEHAKKYQPFQRRLVDYGLWMVSVHSVGTRSKNTGYAFEGLIPAYLAAESAKLVDAQHMLGCAIDKGITRISSMQLGHPLALGLAAEAPALARIQGGVQNDIDEPALRIDTTQHQMHAVIMMSRLLSGRELI